MKQKDVYKDAVGRHSLHFFIIFIILSSLSFASFTAVISSDPVPTDTLQSVTDRGSVTTNAVTVNNNLNVNGQISGTNLVSNNQICFGASCRTSWAEAEGVDVEYLEEYMYRYVNSRGHNLLTNSWLLLDSIYNFDRAGVSLYSNDSVGYKHSLKVTGSRTVLSNEFVPIDSNKMLYGSIYGKALQHGGNPASNFIGIQQYDKNGNAIGVNRFFRNDNTETYLSQDLLIGDTEICVDNITNWGFSGNNNRVGIFSDTYYRNNYHDYYLADADVANRRINAINSTTNCGTLTAPWSVRNIEVGTPVASMRVGASYAYFIGAGLNAELSTDEWRKFEGVIYPRDSIFDNHNIGDFYRPGVSFVQLVIISANGGNNDYKYLWDGMTLIQPERSTIVRTLSETLVESVLSPNGIAHFNPRFRILASGNMQWFQSSSNVNEFSPQIELLYESSDSRLRINTNLRVDGTVFYGALSALSPHALLGEPDIGYTRICKQATDGAIVMKKIEFIDGKYQSVYYKNEEDCQKIQLVESHEKEFIKVDSTNMIQRTHGLYKNIWTNELEENHQDEIIPIPLYEIGEKVQKGELFIYDNIVYEVLQTHITQDDWKPDEVPTIYKIYVDYTTPSEWVQPQGSHDCYPLNAQVTFNGQTYKSNHDCNVWQPPTLWSVVE